METNKGIIPTINNFNSDYDTDGCNVTLDDIEKMKLSISECGLPITDYGIWDLDNSERYIRFNGRRFLRRGKRKRTIFSKIKGRGSVIWYSGLYLEMCNNYYDKISPFGKLGWYKKTT